MSLPDVGEIDAQRRGYRRLGAHAEGLGLELRPIAWVAAQVSTLTERDSRTAAAPVAGYLTGAYGLDPAHAEAVAMGGSPEQVAERLAAYWPSARATW